MLQDMRLWTEVRRRVLTGEISQRKACTEYELHWQTLQKILGHVEPPGYRGGNPRFQTVGQTDPSLVPYSVEKYLGSDECREAGSRTRSR